MYIPDVNRIDEKERINSFIQAHGFATVITHNNGHPWASHLPVLLDEAKEGHGVLRSHMARANEQWRHFESGQEVLCIFHGPHSYISPSSYVMQETVPTWNYAVVHVYGMAKVVENAATLRKIVTDTTTKYESHRPVPWKITLPEAALEAMLNAIVGFTIQITRIEAKFKLGQNRSQADQSGMLRDLQASTDPGDQQLARFITAQNTTAKTEVNKNE
jgi:transcriptional regulator